MPNASLSAADRPNLIRQEGQGIELTFTRTGPTTGRLSWNIPVPADGCDATNRAYNGILLTGSTRPATQLTAPVNGQRYSADATMDADLHAGDAIGGALVVEALYGDLTTTFVDVSGLSATVPYYFTAHAVDAVLNYYRAGVHSYSASLSDGVDTPGAGPAMQGVNIPIASLANSGMSLTGLDPTQNYTMTVTLNGRAYPLVITGADAQTYSQLEIALARAVDQAVAQTSSHQAPNTGVLYYDGTNLSKWLGNEYAPIRLLVKSATRPDQPADNQWWFNTTTRELFQWDATGSLWEAKSYITFSADPANPRCGMYLFNGTTAYVYNGSAWCEAQTFVQSTNPFIPLDSGCSFYWYNTTNGQLVKRLAGRWVGAPAIYSAVDPNAIPNDTYWFNSATSKAFRRSGGSWIPSTPLIVTGATDSRVTTPTGGTYWYDPSTQQLKRRALLNDVWVDLPTVTFGQDPAVRLSCDDLWWNATNDVLSSWDELNDAWVAVDRFEIQAVDPSAEVVVDEDAVWVDDDGVLHTYIGPCDDVSVIMWTGGDPHNITNNTIWYNDLTDKFYLRTAGAWVEFIPTRFIANPQTLPLGTFWSDGTSLYQWNGIAWIEVSYVTTTVTPANGSTWFNLTDLKLYVWNGVWAIGAGVLNVVTYLGPSTIIDPWGPCTTCSTCESSGFTLPGFYFVSTATGSDQCVRLTNTALFAAMSPAGIVMAPLEGSDAISPLPAYMTEGVGTDGSEEERNLILRDVVLSLGGSSVTIELSKEDLDHSLDRALRELRRLAAPYTRGYFPINIDRQDQKRWILSNKRQGHNKIVRVLGVYRSTGLWTGVQGGGVSQNNQPWLYGMMAGKGSGDMLTYHLLASYISELDTMLARKITYFFNERSRVLEIHNRLGRNEILLIEGSVEMPEQEIMLDRRYRAWIERWAVAESQVKLAEIRGKFTTLPGPNGGVVMNAAELRTASDAAFVQLRLEVDNFIVQDPTEFPGAFFCIG